MNRDWKVKLVVNNYLEDKESSNVIGVIKGQVEPDRYVIIGMLAALLYIVIGVIKGQMEPGRYVILG